MSFIPLKAAGAVSSSESGNSATLVPKKPAARNDRKESSKNMVSEPRRMPLYAVVLLDDEVHSVDYAVESLQKVFGYGWLKAMALIHKVEWHGRAHVWTGPLETAEFKRDRLQSCGTDPWARNGPTEAPLDCDIEPLAS